MRQEQFSGSLIGQCLGDALGFIVEGQPPVLCERFVRSLGRELPPAYGRGRFAFGQYSDDSQLARELLQSFAARGAFEPADYAARVGAIFAEERIVGRGAATERAAARIAAGVPWDQAGAPPPQAGNGSAMRAAPVGLLFHRDHAALVRAAHDQGRITHQDPRASAGAVAIAAATALAAEPGPIDAARFLGRLAELAGELSAPMAAHLRGLGDCLALAPDAAVRQIADAGSGELPSGGWLGISPFVIPSVLWSLYAFLRTPDDYWATICTAIAVGGDVDTTAAMSGAISGARVGLGRLPAIASAVNDQGTWDYAALVALANTCFALVTR